MTDRLAYYLTYFSTYLILEGEHARVRRHMEGLGMSAEAISRAPRRYWRRMARYSCPEPSIIIRGLFDVYTFFREMDDPLRPGHKFLTHDAEAIFVKEIGYVQKGYLSDMPGVNYYFCVRICSRTQFVYLRSSLVRVGGAASTGRASRRSRSRVRKCWSSPRSSRQLMCRRC